MHSQKRYFITFIFYMYDWWDFLFTSINYPWFNTMKSTDLVEISAWLTNQLTQPGYYHLLYKGIWNKTHRLQVHTIHSLATTHISYTGIWIKQIAYFFKIVMIISYQEYHTQQIILSFHILIGLIHDILHFSVYCICRSYLCCNNLIRR